MTFSMKPLSCDPARIKGMSERLIISHYENNYGGAVKRLNLIEEKLAELDYGNAPGFLINGLKREQLIAMNSMVLHELFFDGLGEQSEPGGVYWTRSVGTLVRMSAGDPSSLRWEKRSVAARAGCCCRGPRAITSSSINGRLITATRLPAARQFSALDMYEHSYHIDFGAKPATYVDTFMAAIRWSNCDRLFNELYERRGEAVGP